MVNEKQRTSLISAAGKVIRDLVSQPLQPPEDTEDDESGTIYAQPLPTEMAIENGRPALYPADGYLQDGIRFLKGRTIWAIDGGILTWEFPNGLLLIGRAVVSRMSFSGYESVQRVFDVPVIPFVVYPPLKPGTATPQIVEELSRDYLQYVLGSLPQPSVPEPNRSRTNYFADGEEFLASLPESYYAASAARRTALTRYIDQIRDVAELVAFLYALRNAGAKDIVMRDGRIHGGAGFLTRLVKKEQSSLESDKGNSIVREVIQAIRNAVDHGVRVLGIIKHPRSNYCTAWYAQSGVETAKYVASDALLYHRAIEPAPSERTLRLYGSGKRSCLWQIRESGYGAEGTEKPIEIEQDSGRKLVHWFYQNTGCLFIKPKEGVLPIRVDFILHNNHYRSWFADNLDEQLYTLCTGSGSPFGLPQPIVIADGYAKVHRPELTRSIDGLIAQFENSTDNEDKRIAMELRAYLDIYYRGALG